MSNQTKELWGNRCDCQRPCHQRLLVLCFRRGLHEAGNGNPGGAGLVHGAAGDDTDSPLRLRHGVQQGELSTRSASMMIKFIAQRMSSCLKLIVHQFSL